VSPHQRVPSPEARRRIVGATGRLLMDQRFRELTVDSVMAEAGISRTVFYRHFASLADIVVALLDEAVEPAPPDAADPSDPDSLRRMLARTVDLYARHGHLLVAVEEASHHDAEVERVYRDAFERSVEATAGLLSAGGHDVAPVALARALMHLNAGYLGDVLARDPSGDREQALATLWTIWSRLLAR
jgi:AcrR family transcriptional regulator